MPLKCNNRQILSLYVPYAVMLIKQFSFKICWMKINGNGVMKLFCLFLSADGNGGLHNKPPLSQLMNALMDLVLLTDLI